MEQEVPEIEDGIIAIKKIVRIPGDRAKVAVESYDDRIDPVGACVGMKGSRIHGVVRELKNENIDIVPWTTNEQLLIQRSLTPAKVSHVELIPETKRASVFLDADQVSLAIGRGGSNIKLAGRLSGYEIDVFRNDLTYDDVEDVDLEEFADEIDSWVLDSLKAIGCDTARGVLKLSREELVRRSDLEEETVDEVMAILASEFEGEDKPTFFKTAPTDAEVQARAAQSRAAAAARNPAPTPSTSEVAELIAEETTPPSAASVEQAATDHAAANAQSGDAAADAPADDEAAVKANQPAGGSAAVAEDGTAVDTKDA